MRTKAEINLCCHQPRSPRSQQELEEEVSLRAFGESVPCLGFGILASRADRINFCSVVRYVAICYGSPNKMF